LDEPPAAGHQQPVTDGPRGPRPVERAVAVLEVLICSDFATQIPLAYTFAALGFPLADAHMALRPMNVFVFSLVDTVLLVGLIFFMLASHRERARDVFLGPRPAARDAQLGVLLIPAALFIGLGVLVAIQLLAPRLHTVPVNPFQGLLKTRRDALLFAGIVIVAGGLREEVQRAFLIHRFEQYLGGAVAGVVITSVGFGLGHLPQGADAAIATGTLGALWAIVYLWRRSMIAPLVSHSGFDLLQIVQFLALGH
jgi:membrane protease YdiL (CAAX protease family)